MLTVRHDGLAGRTEKISHDSMGRILSVGTTAASGGGTQTFGIDQLGNLRTAGSDRIRFQDPRHPLRATALQSATLTESLVYDAAGRVRQAGARRYEWNADDLPSEVQDPTVGTVDFLYSADGERAAKTGPNLTAYLGGIYEITRRGMTLVERYHVPSPAGVVATVERTGGANGVVDRARWLLTDYQGSVETTWVVGQAAEHVRYDPYGGVVDGRGSVTGTSPTGDVTMGYTAHEHDGELGLINMNGRIYDPHLRRFLTGDPLGRGGAQGLNRYSYVGNRPFDLTDPSGWQAADADPAEGPHTADEARPLMCGAAPCVFPIIGQVGESASGAGASATGGRSGDDGATSEQSGASQTGQGTPTAQGSTVSAESPAVAHGLASTSMLERTPTITGADIGQHLSELGLGTVHGLSGGLMSPLVDQRDSPLRTTGRTWWYRAGQTAGGFLGYVLDGLAIIGGPPTAAGGTGAVIVGVAAGNPPVVLAGGAEAVFGVTVTAIGVVGTRLHTIQIAEGLAGMSAAMSTTGGSLGGGGSWRTGGRLDLGGGHAREHLRRHRADSQATARRLGLELPRTIDEVEEFLAYVVANGEHRVGARMPGRGAEIPGAHWYRLGDAIVVTRPNGQYLTNLDFARAGSALDWNAALPVPP